MNKYKIDGNSDGCSTIWSLKKRYFLVFWITIFKTRSLEACVAERHFYEFYKPR